MATKFRTTGGILVWRPDQVDIREDMLIRTDIPLMDNVWLMIHAQSCIWLTKFRIYAPTEELMQDLESELQYRTYKELVRRVRTGKYDRNYSLYMNIRSCCWSLCYRVVQKWTQHVEQLKHNISYETAHKARSGELIDGIDAAIASENLTKLTTASDQVARISELTRKRRGHKLLTYETDRRHRYTMDNLPAYIEDDWMTYLETCYEMGIEARLTKEEFVCNNYSNVVRSGADKKQLRTTLAEDMLEEERKAADKIRERYAKKSASTSQSST